MPELSEYELDDGTTVQLSEEDVKRFPGAKKVGGPHKQQQGADPKPQTHSHEPVHNRARRT